jgi:hypothetical protein
LRPDQRGHRIAEGFDALRRSHQLFDFHEFARGVEADKVDGLQLYVANMCAELQRGVFTIKEFAVIFEIPRKRPPLC